MSWPTHDQVQTVILLSWVLGGLAPAARRISDRIQTARRERSGRKTRQRRVQQLVNERANHVAQRVGNEAKHRLWAIHSGDDSVA